MTNRVTFTFLFLLLAACAFADDKPSAQELLDAAHRTADLSSLGSYVVTARVVVNAGDSRKERVGNLTISRDHDLSRIELNMDGTDEVQIQRDQLRYIVPSRRLLRASGLVHFDESWDPLSSGVTESYDKYSLGKAHSETVGQQLAWCFDMTTTYMQFRSKEKLCIDATRRVLLLRSEHANRWSKFMDYAEMGVQRYPQRVSIVREHMAPFEVTDIHVAPASLPAELFEPPGNAIEVETCANQRPAEAKKTPEPVFPARGSADRQNAMVVLDVIVAKDGTVAFAKSLTPDESGFSESAERTVRTWQFKPATCNGRAIATEMEVEVSFRLL